MSTMTQTLVESITVTLSSASKHGGVYVLSVRETVSTHYHYANEAVYRLTRNLRPIGAQWFFDVRTFIMTFLSEGSMAGTTVYEST